MTRRALLVSTVGQSLMFQSPSMFDVLASEGYEVSHAVGRDDWTEALSSRGQTHVLELSRHLGAKDIAEVRQQLIGILDGQQWDLIQVQSPIAAAILRTVPRLKRYKTIYVAHGFHFQRGNPWRRNLAYGAVEVMLAGRTSALAVVSSEDFQAATRLGFDRRTLLWHLPGAGVDLQAFRPRYAVGRDAPLALFCGELNDNKDPLCAVRAVQEVRRRSGVDVRLLLIGSGPLSREIEAAGESLHWLEWRPFVTPEEMPGIMRRAGVLLAPSQREGLPRVLVEAVASATPVVARSNRGSREVLAHASGVRLVQGNDVAEWARAIGEVIGSRLSVSVVQQMTKYGIESFSASYRALLQAVESGKRDLPAPGLSERGEE